MIFIMSMLQIFISRDGGSKKFSSVLAPGHHEGIKWGTPFSPLKV